MATTATARQARPLQRRRIIDRPRLFALLDESKACVRTLVAPAGYGKTTLAEQWVARDGRRGAWYTARRSSTDVAALALGLAKAATAIVEGCDERLRGHLRVLPAPAENVEVLAEILGEDLAMWPAEGWLVLDDYQEVARGASAEQFVAALATGSPVQLLIAGRVRPSWVSTRGILYGDVLELNQTALAMDAAEAAEVLSDWSPRSASGLVALANGWPAVIGLAGVSGVEPDDQVDVVPESLYRFFAEEVYASLGRDVQRDLATLAVAPVLDRDLVSRLLGDDRGEATCLTALDTGILVERGPRLDLHPLCRSFLDEQSQQIGFVPADDVVPRCLEHYREAHDWDAAFDLLVKHGPAPALGPILGAALDELLETARLSTIETWCEFAIEAGLDEPIYALARAEVALRHGRHTEAQAHAEAAAADGSDLRFRALTVAGRAAHLASREHEGLELYRHAEAAAADDEERRDALWGQLICTVELELPESTDTLLQLAAGVRRSDPRDVVRAAGYGLSYQIRFGKLELTEADAAWELVDSVSDPLIASSFCSTYSVALGLSARYRDALSVARRFLATARQYRLEFAVPYALSSVALAMAGLRRWKDAERALSEASSLSRAMRSVQAQQTAYSLLTRVLLQQGRHQAALVLEIPPLGTSPPAACAEVHASRALALVSSGSIRDGLKAAEPARGISKGVEPLVLLAAVDALAAVRLREGNAIDLVMQLEEVAFSTGAVDLLVTAYRSNPDLLGVLLRASTVRDRFAALMRRAGDSDIASLVGHPIAIDDDPRARLSAREHEVYELLVHGLTNLQIANILFISPATVKVHVQHIFDKLGTRTRSALMVQAALERSAQATSAIESKAPASDESS